MCELCATVWPMAVRRRHSQPPYEVMGGTRGYAAEPGYRASGWPPSDPDGETVDMEPLPEHGVGGSYMSWRGQTTGPIILRLPKAYALLLAAMLIAMVVLAYWVGEQRGQKAAKAQATRRQEQQMELASRGQAVRPGVVAAPPVTKRVAGATNTPSPRQMPASLALDKRVTGMNYYVVALLPQNEASQAKSFLGANGVETFLQFVENRGLYEVIALRGFERPDDTAREFERELKRLGRLWKKGPNTFSPWLRKYDGRLARSRQR